jgi:hypothetical protein
LLRACPGSNGCGDEISISSNMILCHTRHFLYLKLK